MVDLAQLLEQNLFRREGDYWTVAYQGRECRVKDMLGLHYLAHLLRHPHRLIHALDLTSSTEGVQYGALADPTEGKATASLEELGMHVSRPDGTGEILDAQAKTAYRRRLRELQGELEEARAFNDLGQVERLQGEIEFFTHELAQAVGLGGRPRTAA